MEQDTNAAAIDDDEPETFACYRHPDRQTALRCKDCDRPICVDCAVQGAVGIKCPDCARTSRAARAVVPLAKLVRGALAGAVVAFALGAVLFFVNVGYLGILAAFLAWLVGMAVGEATRRGSGGYRDPMLARIAAVAAAAGMLAFPAMAILANGGASPRYLAFTVLAAAVAAYGAFQRAA
jgi:hypothetical protein